MNVAYCVVVVFLAKLIASGISAVIPTTNTLLSILNTFFGSQYVWITTIAMFAATVGEKQVENLSGSQEIGTYFIYLFLFVIGVPASIVKIITETPLLLVFTGIMVLTNMLFCFVFGKLLHFDLEDIILASNANIGGPNNRSRNGNLPGMDQAGRTGYADRYFWLCHRYIPWCCGWRSPRRVITRLHD